MQATCPAILKRLHVFSRRETSKRLVGKDRETSSIRCESSRVSAPDLRHATTRVFCRGHVCTQALTGLTGETRTRRFARSTTRAGATRRGDPPGPRGRSRPRGSISWSRRSRAACSRWSVAARRRPQRCAPAAGEPARPRGACGSVRPCLQCGKTTHQVSVVCPLSSRSRLLSSRTLATVCHAINRVVNSHRGSTTSAASLLGLACARARLRTLCVPVQKRTWY